MNSRILFYSIIGSLVVIIIFFFIGKSYGKSIPPAQIEPPVDGSSPGIGDAAIRSIVDALKDDIYSIWTRDSEPYIDLYGLSNTDFVKAYNDWNARYYKLDNETLKEAINDENFSITSYTFANLKDDLINRFTSLGLP